MHRRILYFSSIVLILLLSGCNVSLDYWRSRATFLLFGRSDPPDFIPTVTLAPTQLVTLQIPTPFPTLTPLPSVTPTLPSEPFFEDAKTINGMEITLNNIRRDGKWLNADICFPVLDGEDWMLNHISFSNGEIDTRDHSSIVIEPIIPAKDGIPGRRCDTVMFDLGEAVDLSEFTITVHSIYAPPREGGTCARAEIVAQKMAEQGIKIACIQEDNFEGYRISEKPATMSDDEAGQLLMDAMWYVIKGPWVFNARLH